MPGVATTMEESAAPRVETAEDHIARLRARIAGLTDELAAVRQAQESPYFTRYEAAAYYRCHVCKIDRLLASGRVKRYRLGREVLIRKADLAEVVET